MERTLGVQGRRQKGGRGVIAPPNIPIGGPGPLNKIGATECMLLLLHPLDGFQNALLLYMCAVY